MGRADDVLAGLSREERIAQLGSLWVAVDAESAAVVPHPRYLADADRPPLSERTRHDIGQLTRPFGSRAVEPATGASAVASFQAGRRIAAIVHEECLSGFMAHGATAFPCPLNLGSSFNPALVREVAAAIGMQMAAVGVHQGLAPLLDVVRDGRWGRVEECFGEDPHLVGCVGTAYVAGIESAGIVATPKHFAGYPASEGGRNLAPAHMGPRELRDVFLPPFEMAVRLGGARAVMNAYQDIDGLPVAASAELLTGVLRDEWGFEGIVVSDYFSVAWLEQLHGVAADKAEAAALALHAGVDVELPDVDCYGAPLSEALERGLVTQDLIDRSVLRVLRLKEQLGLLDLPEAKAPATSPIVLDTAEHRALARRAADESIVLLQNGTALPVQRTASLALIGPNADAGSALLGNYSFQSHVAATEGGPSDGAPDGVTVDSIAHACRQRFGGPVDVEQGCEVVGEDRGGFDAACAAAARADVAVVVVGDQAGNFGRGTSGEGTDADDLRLPGVQEDLVLAVAATGTPTVVVLVAGRPYDLSRIAPAVDAVVCSFFPGEEGGAAVADVLCGRVNPSGRTSLSFGRGAGQQPFTYHHKRLARRGYARSTSRPVFPFGHGLSYTTFDYADLRIESDKVPVDGTALVSCTITNTGERPGAEVVQLYVRDVVGSVTRPVLELRGFSKVSIDPGRSARVLFTIPADVLSFTGPDLRRIVEPGTIEVMVGASSRDIRLRGSFELTGQTRGVGPGRLLSGEVSVEA